MAKEGERKLYVGQIPWEPVDTVYVAASAAGVVEIGLGGTLVAFIAGVRQRMRTVVTDERAFAPDAAAAADAALAQLADYFAGRRSTFDVAIDWRAMTDFQRAVYECIIQIPPGQMDSYQGVAKKLGKPDAVRAVGGALARNPIPILIPCHRVVGSDGTMIGYSGGTGVETKRLLLKIEGALLF